ncbi:Putative ribonuclease H protein At1g65750 [Linum perenne]
MPDEAMSHGDGRNDEGRVLGAFTVNLGKCSITRAELTGAVIGMDKAWEMGIRDLTVQLDSLCAVKILTEDGSLENQHATLVSRYRSLLQRNWKLQLVHIFREGNRLADSLANMGHSMSFGLHSVSTSDATVQYWSNYDRVGGAVIRRIVV